MWKSDKLSGYLTKYIHKDFENSARSAKRYWHTKNIEEIKVIKFWLGATNFHEALEEARDSVANQGVAEMKIWGDYDIGISGFLARLQVFTMGDLYDLALFNQVLNKGSLFAIAVRLRHDLFLFPV